jgi:hypothetical protein
MVTTTTPQLFVKTPQYIEEVTEGTTPATPAFASCGPVKTLSLMIDGKWVDVSQIGSEDLISIIQGLTDYQIKMKLAILNSTFIKYAINAANPGTPAGTISASLSILWSIYLNNVENFIIAKGARAKTFAITMEKGKADEVDIEFECTGITTPNTTGPSGASYAATPSGTVLGHLDGGANPVSIGGTGVLAQKITINVNRNTSPDYVLGSSDPISTKPHGRRITGTIDVLWTNVTQETSFKTPTIANIVVVLKASGPTITMANAPIKTYKREADSDGTDSIIEGLGFGATSIICT